MGRKHKSFPRGNGESGEIRKLKDAIKRLSSDKRQLLSEVRTLREAFEKAQAFIHTKIERVTIDEVVDAVKSGKGMKEIERCGDCEACGSANTKLMKLLSVRVRICQDCKTRKKLKSVE
jgi:hypothetical protein